MKAIYFQGNIYILFGLYYIWRYTLKNKVINMTFKKIQTIAVILLIFTLVSTSYFTSITVAKYDKTKQTTVNQLFNLSTITNKKIEYVLITPSRFVNSFTPLINHKSQYLNATIVTKEEILQNKSYWVNGTYGDGENENPWIEKNKHVTTNFSIFNDSSAKIRNFIRFAHKQWHTEFVLLGGDDEFIPSRSLYAFIPNWSAGRIVKPIEAFIVSDHYYSGLNGTWNNDFDNRFGEEPCFSVEEEADFTAEVTIGRAPVNDEHDVNVFVNKVISYETSEKPKNIQLHQSYTNPQHIPDTSKVTDMCQQWIPDSYEIYTLYEKNEKVTVNQWINCFSKPEKLLIFHVGNGYNDGLYSWYQLSWDGQKRIKFDVLNVGSVSNSFYPIHISISCLIGDFTENESLAEELLLNRNGGPSSCIVNSEVGCISRDDAGAYSAEFFEQIFKNIFNESIQNLGKKVQLAKERFSDIASFQRQYRWCFYEINLLGDPESPVFFQRKFNESNSITYFVDDDFNQSKDGWNKTKFNTIQSAIDSIHSHGTILINNGTYKEHLIVNKTITLQGIDKSNVILSNKNNQSSPLIKLKCHSTKIQNMTIKWNASFSTKPKAIIQIVSGCNGNTIKNNIIYGPGDYGILLLNSIRNIFSNNRISKSNCGIGIINDLGGILPSRVIITCDNIISQNRIEQYKECGMKIKGSIHNYIFNNSFLDNGFNNSEKYPFLNNHIKLIKTKLNEIDNNYWNEPRTEPYPIKSLKGPITFFSIDISRGIVFKLFECILIVNIGYPSIVFDCNPAQHPILQ